MAHREQERTRLSELAGLFLKLGATAFGGPAAHIAMMEAEVVRRRGWMTHERFLDLLGATNLIPGPNSTEMAIHIGHARAGWRGLVVAGTCFIVPAWALVTAIGWLYVRFGVLPQAAGVLYAVKPILIAVVVEALWRLGKTALKSGALTGLAAASVGASILGAHELLVLAVAGAIAMVFRRPAAGPARARAPMALAGVQLAGTGAVASAALPFGLAPLFLVFLKIGAVLFGSGYVLLAFLRRDLVERYHWLTESQLLDAIGVGQITPGPVFTTATFVGYILGGPVGGLVATVGIFLPAFVFVALSSRIVPHVRRSPTAGAFLDGVNVASLALMAVVTWQLGRASVVDPPTATLAIGAAVLLLRYRVNSAWLVLGGGAFGLVLSRFGLTPG